MLARVLGGEVFRSEEAEIGWLPIRSKDPNLVPEGPWFNWHFDTFTLPPGATLVAETDAAPQAFSAGRSLGLQFHPEVTQEIMDDWIRSYRHELEDEGVAPHELMKETKRRIDGSREMALRLFDRFLSDVARLVPEGSSGGTAEPAVS
jgi:hypothetical protein